MTRAGQKILTGARQALAYARGDTTDGFVVHDLKQGSFSIEPGLLDVRAIRDRLGLSRPEFARRFGFGVGSVRDWELGKRAPQGSARVLLRVIDREPDAVSRALIE
jgi:putative transcriptional regulator